MSLPCPAELLLLGRASCHITKTCVDAPLERKPGLPPNSEQPLGTHGRTYLAIHPLGPVKLQRTTLPTCGHDLTTILEPGVI